MHSRASYGARRFRERGGRSSAACLSRSCHERVGRPSRIDCANARYSASNNAMPCASSASSSACASCRPSITWRSRRLRAHRTGRPSDPGRARFRRPVRPPARRSPNRAHSVSNVHRFALMTELHAEHVERRPISRNRFPIGAKPNRAFGSMKRGSAMRSTCDRRPAAAGSPTAGRDTCSRSRPSGCLRRRGACALARHVLFDPLQQGDDAVASGAAEEVDRFDGGQTLTETVQQRCQRRACARARAAVERCPRGSAPVSTSPASAA